MHKTPDEIKTGVEFCTAKVVSGNLKTCDLDCPYRVEGAWCRNALAHDTLAYIQQLERERIMLMNTVSKMCGKTPRWISVEERLPEGICIAVNDMGSMIIGYIGEDKRSDTGYSCEDERFYMPSVTHWMPLPEPPEED